MKIYFFNGESSYYSVIINAILFYYPCLDLQNNILFMLTFPMRFVSYDFEIVVSISFLDPVSMHYNCYFTQCSFHNKNMILEDYECWRTAGLVEQKYRTEKPSVAAKKKKKNTHLMYSDEKQCIHPYQSLVSIS